MTKYKYNLVHNKYMKKMRRRLVKVVRFECIYLLAYGVNFMIARQKGSLWWAFVNAY